MVMNSAWIKNNARELRKTLGRFLAMVSIVALGVGFFVGLKSSRPAMVETCTSYLNDMHFYDLQLISSLGFDPDAGDFYEAIDGVEAAEAGFSAPMLVEVNGQELVFQTHQIMPTLNQVTVTAGRMPQAPNECLADDMAFSESALGTELVVKHQEDSPFSQDVYTIVGLGRSPQYLTTATGGTSLGSGSLAGFLFLPPESFDVDYATDVFIRLEGSHAPFASGYLDDLETAQADRFRPLLEQQGQIRLDALKQNVRDKLDEGWKEYQDGTAEFEAKKAETEAKFADAQRELDDAKLQLADAERQLADGEAQLNRLINDPYSVPELADARQQLDEGHRQYAEGLRQYEEGKAQYQQLQGPVNILITTAEQGLTKAQAALNESMRKYQQAETAFQQAEAAVKAQQEQLYGPVLDLEQQMNLAEADLSQKQAALEQLKTQGADEAAIAAAEAEVEAARTEAESRRSAYETAKAAYDAQAAAAEQQLRDARAQLDTAKAGLDQAQQAVNQYQAQIDSGKQQLRDAKFQLIQAESQLEEARQQLSAGEEELETQLHSAIATAQTELNNGRQQLESGRKDYEQGLVDLEDGKKEAHAEFSKAKKDLAQAQRELRQGELDFQRMEDPSYFVLTPRNNNSFSSFENDTKIIESIANIFPLFFFLVAALVCSSTMTRMVEEQRTQNGTLKALGYSDFHIMMRYAGYAGLAAVTGVVIGVLIGTFLFPYVIWGAYKLLYHIGELDFVFHWSISLISLTAALICCVGAACAAAWNDLRQMPAGLMRPKAPKAGKRIFLEYITPLWNHTSFLAKVSFRNIFRYKKRLFMMILGTAGCLALLIAGLGLKDSISQVADDQFDRISLYDYMITFSSEQTEEDQAAFREELGDRVDALVYTDTRSLEVPAAHGTKTLNLVATNDPAMDDLLGLFQDGTDLGYPSGDGLYLSNGLAESLGVHAGDTLPVILESKNLIEIPIDGVFTNHVFHAAYMSADGFETWFGIAPELKTAYASTSSEDLDAVGAALQNGAEVVNVTSSQSIRSSVADSMSSLDAVVLLVVACAVALSFVVGYNLININITERVREIATIKVLGFYRKETYVYVFRESLILTVLGAVVGIPLGIWLHGFIMGSITVDFVSFQVRIAPLSFVIAVSVTILVTLLVNAMLSRKIDKINMAESLKSVE